MQTGKDTFMSKQQNNGMAQTKAFFLQIAIITQFTKKQSALSPD